MYACCVIHTRERVCMCAFVFFGQTVEIFTQCNAIAMSNAMRHDDFLDLDFPLTSVFLLL